MSDSDFLASPSSRPASRLRRAGRWTALAVLIAFSLTFGVLIGATFDASENATASTMLTQMPEFQVVEETYDAIRENYVLSDEISDQDLMYGASRGMVEALGDDGHSTFLDPQEAKEFEQSLSNELIGIGVQIDLTGPQPVVIAPIDGSPAYEAGIQPGDVIIAVDGVETAEVEPTEVGELIRGEEGTDVTLVLRHQDDTETYEVTITRSRITIEPVSYIMLPDNVLWLRVSQFSVGATQGVIEALQWGKDNGATGVILDLRNNPGGYTQEAKGIASQFLPIGSVLYQEQLADGTVQRLTNTDIEGEWIEGDLVVLINAGSASSSEIVSSAISDNERGVLIGETTFGTGTVLIGFELSDGSVALLGTKLWLTADGNDIWKHGVDPTVEVEMEDGDFPKLPIEFEGDAVSASAFTALDDPQLLAAHEEISVATARSGS
jgi:carboxyl-terminal processing protease